MAESKEVKETQTVVDPFGVIPPKPIKTKADKRYLDTYGVELDKATGTTKVVVTGKIDLVEMIQANKDLCGMELVKKMIATGQADPSEFADDGAHGGDFSLGSDPTTVYMAAQEAAARASKASQELAALGLTEEQIKTISGEDLHKLIMDKVNAVMATRQEETK